jgi:Uncharacterized protein conserved in bacteria (DUF2252)
MQESNQGRIPQLVAIRHGRMLQSPFAFFRGAALNMAADLAGTPATGIRVQACGDCHLSNFGSYGTPERRVIFDINDLDETLPAPCEWDVKRLAASFVLAVGATASANTAPAKRGTKRRGRLCNEPLIAIGKRCKKPVAFFWSATSSWTWRSKWSASAASEPSAGSCC